VLYLLVIVGLVALTVLFWRAFGPEGARTVRSRVRGPDDDQEFLRRLDSGTPGRPHPGSGSEGSPDNDPPRD